MAGKTIDQLPAAGSLDGTELLPIKQGGATKRVAASALGALSAGVSAAQAAAIGAATGSSSQTFATLSALNTAITAERARITAANPADPPQWPNGKTVRVATEPVSRMWTVGASAAASNALTVNVGDGVTTPLGADTNAILTTSGTPSAGTGANGDVAVDRAGNTYYPAKTGGAWPAGQAINTLLAGHTTSIGLNTAAIAAAASSVYPRILTPQTKWNAAKLRGAANPPRIMVVGDSNVAQAGAGTSGTALMVGARQGLGWVTKFGQLCGANDNAFFGEGNAGGTAGVAPGSFDSRLTLGAGWTGHNSNYSSVGGRQMVHDGVAGNLSGLFTFTPGSLCDSAEVWMPQTSTLSSSVDILLDGSVLANVSQANATAGFIKRTYTFTAGSGHVFGVKNNTSGATAFCSGIIPRLSTSTTPILIRHGIYGADAAGMNTASSPWSPLPGSVAVAPDKVLYCLTINDINLSTVVATYIASVRTAINAYVAIADVTIVVCFQPSVNSDTGLLDTYALALRKLAIDLGCGYYDQRSVLGHYYTTATARGYVYDLSHPSLAGHAVIAQGTYAHEIASGWAP